MGHARAGMGGYRHLLRGFPVRLVARVQPARGSSPARPRAPPRGRVPVARVRECLRPARAKDHGPDDLQQPDRSALWRWRRNGQGRAHLRDKGRGAGRPRRRRRRAVLGHDPHLSRDTHIRPATARLDALREMPGVRVVVRLGPERLLRAAAVLFLLAMVGIVAVFFPEFFDPTRIGGDVSNYYAAGQRLNAGHDLYAIQPGDRMGPPNPPYWTVPLLNPPPIAVLWRPLAALGDVAMYAWWIAAAVVSVITVAWLVRRSRALGLWLLILLSPAVALLCVAGNVGAFLFPVYGLIWWADRNDRPQIAGVAVAAAASVIVSPVVYFEQISLLVTIAIPFARTSNAPTRAPARPPT